MKKNNLFIIGSLMFYQCISDSQALLIPTQHSQGAYVTNTLETHITRIHYAPTATSFMEFNQASKD